MRRLIRLEDGRELRLYDYELKTLLSRTVNVDVDIDVAAEYNGMFYIRAHHKTMTRYMNGLFVTGQMCGVYFNPIQGELTNLDEFKVGDVLLVENGKSHDAYLVVDTSGGRVSCQYFSDGYVKYCLFTDEIKKYYKAVKAEDEKE